MRSGPRFAGPLLLEPTRSATIRSAAGPTAITSRTLPPTPTSWARIGSRWWTTCPPGRPSDEERLNYGFINVIDLPYRDLTDAARRMPASML
jgi:hypothetical protein